MNMSSAPRKLTFSLEPQGFAKASMKTLIASPDASPKGNEVTLEPFGLLIAEVN